MMFRHLARRGDDRKHILPSRLKMDDRPYLGAEPDPVHESAAERGQLEDFSIERHAGGQRRKTELYCYDAGYSAACDHDAEGCALRN